METACDITGRHIGAIAPGELRQTAADLVLQTAILRESLTEANVTRKNRKIRMLRAIYPHVNIQVFYQKDVQDLVMKYRLPERLTR